MSAATICATRPDEPAPRTKCKVADCGLDYVAMVYVWHPNGMSVFEPRCRDHRGGQS